MPSLAQSRRARDVQTGVVSPRWRAAALRAGPRRRNLAVRMRPSPL